MDASLTRRLSSSSSTYRTRLPVSIDGRLPLSPLGYGSL